MMTKPEIPFVALAVEALDRRELFSPKAEIRIALASLFAAQALAREMIADGRAAEVEQIRHGISEIVPELSEGAERRVAGDTLG